MAKILVAWEYGSGMGHVSLMKPLLDRLVSLGHTLHCYFRDTKVTSPLWQGKPYVVKQAPFLNLTQSLEGKPIHTLADILVYTGIADAEKLLKLSHVWHKIIEEEKPDLIICEFAFSVALACLGKVPIITLGSGYTLPPPGERLPNVRNWVEGVNALSASHEDRSLLEFNKVREALRLEPFAFMSDVFGGEASVVCTFPEIDCYAKYRTSPAIGSLNARPPASLIHPKDKERRGYFYLNGQDKRLMDLLEEIKHTGQPSEGFIRHIKEEDRARLHAPPQFILHHTPQNMEDVLKRITLLIHHGGIGTTEMCLLHGIPQMLLTRHLEQRVTGETIAHVLRLGHTVHTKDFGNHGLLYKTLTQAFQTPQYGIAAYKLAKQLAVRYAEDPAEKLVAICQNLLGSQ